MTRDIVSIYTTGYHGYKQTMHHLMNLIIAIICIHITTCDRLDSHKTLTNRLKYYELIPITHDINIEDDFYPITAALEFNAFGNHYKLDLTQNTQLFSKNFFTETHVFNEETQFIEKERTHSTPRCYYRAKVVSDLISSAAHGMLSLCHSHAVSGWIHAFGETIAIHPQSYDTDENQHHLIYKYSDLNRTDYRNINNPHLEHNETPLLSQKPPADVRNRRQLQSTTTRYVEYAVVIDPAMMTEYSDEPYDGYLFNKIVGIVSQVQETYLNTDWGTSVGVIQIILSAIYYVESWPDSQYAPDVYVSGTCPSNGSPSLFGADDDEYCEVSYSDYLSKFIDYADNEMDDADIAHLFTYYDLQDSVIGYASYPGVCFPHRGGVDMTVYDDEYNALIVSAQLGVNFAMRWDGFLNDCDSTDYIMASAGSPYGYRPTNFSNCSIQYMQHFFTDDYPRFPCLDNEPASYKAVCGNGIIEEGEECDCGQSDCGSIDTCCDGTTCQLYSYAECSNLDECCHECGIRNATEMWPCGGSHTMFVAPCDINEYCDGESSECPSDLRHVAGTRCSSGDSFGYCYDGECVSIEEQCEEWNDNYTIADQSCSGYSPKWQLPAIGCGDNINLRCESDGSCPYVMGLLPQDGTPCNLSDGAPAQCVDGLCQYSSEIYTYVWTIYGWNDCSIDCKPDKNASAGNQTRDARCTFLNGTDTKDASLCSSSSKPFGVRSCNDFLCPNTTVYFTTTEAEEDGIKIVIDFSSIFFKGLLAVAVFTGAIILYCFVYIFCASGMMKRIGLPGTQGFFKTIRIVGFCGSLQFVFQVSDIATDYLYAVKLITEPNEDIKMLGWISLFTAILGLVLFGLKTMLIKKLIGYQVTDYKKQLKTLSSTSPKAQEIMVQIRKRNIDIDTLSLLISCAEDVPQAMIVVTLVHSNYEWDAISIANFAMSISSFLWKFVQVMASKIGCKDPTNVFQSKRELELAENMEHAQEQTAYTSKTV